MQYSAGWKRALRVRPALRWAFGVIVAALVGVGAGRTVIANLSGSVSVVDGLSMAPNFQPGERIYTAPITGRLERGAVVLVNDGSREFALKRVVGLPNETVILWRGYVFINRRLLREPYLPRLTFTHPDQRNDRLVFELGPDQYFVMGDNRVCSTDSRLYGPIERNQIRSRVPAQPGAPQPALEKFTLPQTGKRTIRSLELADESALMARSR